MQSLRENPLLLASVGNILLKLGIPYYSFVTLKNKNANAYLHSHEYKIPIKMEHDKNRVTSHGQQVNAIVRPDGNSQWQFYPIGIALERVRSDISAGKSKPRVNFGDRFRLFHHNTRSFLRTHNVAAPMTGSNYEMTTVMNDAAPDGSKAYNDSVWRLVSADDIAENEIFRSLIHPIKIVAESHNVAVHCTQKALPIWGFGQLEVTGFRESDQGASGLNVWHVEDVYMNYGGPSMIVINNRD